MSNNLEEGCHVIAATVIALQPMYQSPQTTVYQRGKLETMIGAAIWYLPQKSSELWTGCISIKALQGLIDGTIKNPTHDHEWPRKVAARELFELSWEDISDPTSEVQERYLSRYGRFNLVLPSENRSLAAHQRADIFIDPRKAYQAAGVELIHTDQLLRTVLKNPSVLADRVP